LEDEADNKILLEDKQEAPPAVRTVSLTRIQIEDVLSRNAMVITGYENTFREIAELIDPKNKHGMTAKQLSIQINKVMGRNMAGLRYILNKNQYQLTKLIIRHDMPTPPPDVLMKEKANGKA
jgi:hypothetical protein